MTKSFHKLTIEAPAESVYSLLTTIDGLKKWWMGQTSGNPGEVGGEIEFGDKKMWYNKMKVSELDENKKVLWETLESEGPSEQAKIWLNTTVEFSLEEKQLERLGGKTVTVVHFKHDKFPEGFDDTSNYAEINWHWAFFLLSLKNIAEGKPGMAMSM